MSRKENSENKKNSQKRQNRSNRQNNNKQNNNKQNNNSRRSNQSMNDMKYEIANEFGVDLGPEASSRCNGKVGGEMTKRLVDIARSSKKKSK